MLSMAHGIPAIGSPIQKGRSHQLHSSHSRGSLESYVLETSQSKAGLSTLGEGVGKEGGERVRKREKEAGETGQEKAENRGEGKRRQERRGEKDKGR